MWLVWNLDFPGAPASSMSPPGKNTPHACVETSLLPNRAHLSLWRQASPSGAFAALPLPLPAASVSSPTIFSGLPFLKHGMKIDTLPPCLHETEKSCTCIACNVLLLSFLAHLHCTHLACLHCPFFHAHARHPAGWLIYLNLGGYSLVQEAATTSWSLCLYLSHWGFHPATAPFCTARTQKGGHFCLPPLTACEACT